MKPEDQLPVVNKAASTAADVEQLRALWSSLLNVLITYMDTTPAAEQTAAMLAIVRAFLRDNEIHADLKAAKDLAGSLRDLRDTTLPFH